jgi:3-oxoacyl-[acyl-carrier-protein] synthase II
MRRVVVTGLGIISPVGNTVESAWTAVKEGRSGIGPITRMDVSAFTTRFGGSVGDFDPTQYMDAKDVRKTDPFMHYGMGAGAEALADSGLEITEAVAERVGCAVSAGIGGIDTIERNYELALAKGPRRISPFFVPASIINMVAGNLSIRHNLRGPNISVVTACTTGTHNIGLAARLIQHGDADVMVAGGAEMATTTLGLGGFCAARALSTRNDDPERASRPWDKDRDGFVLSDGAACLVLEEYAHARARGARIYAEYAGFGLSADAYHITSPSEDGNGARRCMASALADGGLNPQDVDYINAHATSTQAGDIAETQAMKHAFGDHARKLAISSTKSVTGHLLGAAGAAEAVFSVLAIRDGVIPPTINLDEPDPECDLDYVPHTAREQRVSVAMSNSFGFGGTNGTVIFKRMD